MSEAELAPARPLRRLDGFQTGGRRACGAQNKRCYAIGDVHGRLDLLEGLLSQIEADHAALEPKEAILVMLGDLIDRGPDSRGVVARLRQPPAGFARVLCLQGNHEEALVRGMAGEPGLLKNWLAYGGYACAQSYGAPIGQFFGASDDLIRDSLARYIGRDDLAFLASFLDSVRFGDFLMVHAGVPPGAPSEQWGSAVRWIREPFLTSDADFGAIIVHGHTVSQDVEVRSNRIGIDTGAYQSGILTALRIEGDSCAILQAVGPIGRAFDPQPVAAKSKPSL